jgi:uncharacterized membrane protein
MTTAATPSTADAPIPRTIPGAVGWIVAGCLCTALATQAVLEDPLVAGAFASGELWLKVVLALQGTVELAEGQPRFASLPLAVVYAGVAGIAVVSWVGGAVLINMLSGRTLRQSAAEWGSRGWKWWCLAGVWYVLWLISVLSGWALLNSLLVTTVELWWSMSVAGWLTTLVGMMIPPSPSELTARPVSGWGVVAAAVAVYTLVFGAMNWQLYEGLLIPHGDSAMYEEHLWNLLHGKGFRSYLDQGLFLGEHIQFIHLALLPVYLLWPSHLLLELAESLALALTAVPVYTIALRHTGSQKAAGWMAAATLLYFPLQYLDIAIDLKTFRPIAFGVPLLLLAIDQMERRRWKSMIALVLVTLTAKEDYAIVIAPLGVWLCLTSWWERRRHKTGDNNVEETADRTAMLIGAAMAVLASVYLLLAVKVLIPWFREGETVHYARYFSRFGETPTEIVINMLTHPGLLLGEFLTIGTLLYALRVLVPLGGTPLLSPSRLLVGAPLFLLLCLNELAQETPAPVHHFHAPLLPVVFWSAAAGLPNVSRGLQSLSRGRRMITQQAVLTAARFACLCALTSGVVMSLHPLSRKFWDAGSAMHWQRLYVPGERAERFAEIDPLIPPSARVASTDFVHPRFTHHERSYDYSGYLRKVAGYERRVPDDTDYIVIDTRHPYSTMRTPEDVPEFHQPDQWELLTTEPDPWFIVLKRRDSDSPAEIGQP